VATVIALPPIDELEHNVAAKIVEHELGHALGLAHDQHDRYSLMYPSYQGDWQKLTKQDREVVRAKYKVSFVE
jgi:predicted Zn-dependent protease